MAAPEKPDWKTIIEDSLTRKQATDNLLLTLLSGSIALDAGLANGIASANIVSVVLVKLAAVAALLGIGSGMILKRLREKHLQHLGQALAFNAGGGGSPAAKLTVEELAKAPRPSTMDFWLLAFHAWAGVALVALVAFVVFLT